jgi:hypothetical protein
MLGGRARSLLDSSPNGSMTPMAGQDSSADRDGMVGPVAVPTRSHFMIGQRLTTLQGPVGHDMPERSCDADWNQATLQFPWPRPDGVSGSIRAGFRRADLATGFVDHGTGTKGDHSSVSTDRISSESHLGLSR